MAEVSGPSLTISSVLSTTSLAYLIYHAARFDGCRCLIPKKKEWFRVTLLYMVFISNISLLIWAIGWAYVKYQLGWVSFGPKGARPWPASLFPYPYTKFNTPLTIILSFTYTFQASLNAEEGLYFYHLMRSVRRPQAAKPFLRSNFFYAWIGISVCIAVLQMGVPWFHNAENLQRQISIALLTGGCVEFVVLITAGIVVLKFPRFLRDIKDLGAGPDVRTKLYFYHEAKKVRNLFRLLLCTSLIIIGADGNTDALRVNLNPLASDFLSTITTASLCIVMMISIMLYLPRVSPSSRLNRVNVGQHNAAGADRGSNGIAMLSLLAEVGRWDGVDEDLAPAEKGGNDTPFANAEARDVSWIEDEECRVARGAVNQVPRHLELFTSPIAVTSEPQPQRPIQVRMQVERAVHQD